MRTLCVTIMAAAGLSLAANAAEPKSGRHDVFRQSGTVNTTWKRKTRQ